MNWYKKATSQQRMDQAIKRVMARWSELGRSSFNLHKAVSEVATNMGIDKKEIRSEMSRRSAEKRKANKIKEEEKSRREKQQQEFWWQRD